MGLFSVEIPDHLLLTINTNRTYNTQFLVFCITETALVTVKIGENS